MHISSCVDSQLAIGDCRTAKIAMENCERVTLALAMACRNISSVVELINCRDCTVLIEGAETAQTITVDLSADVKLCLPSAWGNGGTEKVLTTQSRNVCINQTPPVSSTEPNVQMITYRASLDEHGRPLYACEQAVREGLGHVARKTQHEADEARRVRNINRLVEATMKQEAAEKALQAGLRGEQALTPPAGTPAGSDGAPSTEDPLTDAIERFAASRSLRRVETHVTTLGDVLGSSSTTHAIPGRPTGFGHASGEDIAEYRDSDEKIASDIAAIAEHLRKAKHAVVYTGAGISTGAGAGLPCYRGPTGVWTLRDQGVEAPGLTNLAQAVPTAAHMGLAALRAAGFIRAIVSTNLDGLHLRSGVDACDLAELHGNAFQERCVSCGKTYQRSYDCTNHGTRADHRTGARCDEPGCAGELVDSIVNFGENLPQDQYERAYQHSSSGDAALVLGTSMVVQPACLLPDLVARNGGAVMIVNRQKIPKWDERAQVRVFGDCDEVVVGVCRALGVAIHAPAPVEPIAPATGQL